MHFGEESLPLQDQVKFLGVEMSRKMSFEIYLKNVAHQTSLSVSALRWVAGYLDAKDLMVLYKT